MKSESAAPALLGQVDRVAAQQRNAGSGLMQCLISSASQTRRNMLSRAAADAGWDTVVCVRPEVALGEYKRTMFHFAMVDLDDRGATPAGARELAQALAQDSSEILVGVCGHEADPSEEIWVRQLGIWLYLPGATTTSEVSLLCEQALEVVSKQRFDHRITAK